MKQERNTSILPAQRGTINDPSLQPRTSAGGGKRPPDPNAVRDAGRFAIITLARREAREAVKRKLRAEGRVRVTLMSSSELNTLADEYLRAHAAELLAAEGSSIVRNLTHSLKRKAVDLQAKSLNETHVQIGEPK
jgi:hypothetical protein